MPKPLSADTRDRFRKLFEGGLSGRKAARRLLISAATASRRARRLRRGASLQPTPNPRKSGQGKLAPYHDFWSSWSRRILTLHWPSCGVRWITHRMPLKGEVLVLDMIAPGRNWQ